MHKPKSISTCLFLIILVTSAARAQLVLGQYEDEAPVRTWNVWGLDTAASMGFGGAPVAFSLDNASSLVNPALMTAGPRISLTADASMGRASFFRYGIVNTGVLRTDRRISSTSYALDYIGGTVRTSRWAFGLSLALLEIYDRPRTVAEESFNGETVYSLDFKQEGALWNINLSAAYELSSALSIGVGINRVYGTSQKHLREDLFYNGNIITDEKNFDFRGYYWAAGLLLRPGNGFALAASFRSPYQKKADGDGFYRFQNAAASSDVRIVSSGESRFSQPAVVAAGAGYTLNPHWRFSLNAAYFVWSRYSAKVFDEDRPRNFRDIVKVYGGVEYRRSVKLFGRSVGTPFRLGFCVDPQPVADQTYNYLYLALSSGIHFKKLFIEIALMLGGERSSGEGLTAHRAALSLIYSID